MNLLTNNQEDIYNVFNLFESDQQYYIHVYQLQ